MEITRSIIEKKIQNTKYEKEVEEIRRKEGNFMASMVGDFGAPYTGKFPDDIDIMGTIADPKRWLEEQSREWYETLFPDEPEVPTDNPIWTDHLTMLLEVTHNNGWPYKEPKLHIIHTPIDEIYTLEAIEPGEDIDKDLYTPGATIGFLKYPTSSGYDLWLFYNPSQEHIDVMEENYDFWAEMY